MASYNGERFIHKQISSILSQISEHDELIISDDKSTDGTLSVINQFNDVRIKLIQNTGSKGPKSNFQNALSHASGMYVFLSDQDDVWLPGKVDKVLDLLTTNDLVLTDCRVINEEGKVLHPSFFILRNSHPGFLYNLYKNSYIGCCMAFRREVLEYALPIPFHVHMHDWWIGLMVEAYGRVCFCPEPLIQYVRHTNNASPTGEGGYNLFKRFTNRLLLALNLGKRILIKK